MAIKIVLERRAHRGEPDISRPMFFCDYCDKPIEEAGKGLYVFPDASSKALHDEGGFFKGEPVAVYTVHKGACDRMFHQERGYGRGDLSPTMELRLLPYYLGNNMGLDWEKVRELAEMMGEIR